MKPLYILLLSLLVSTPSSFAADPVLPDFAKAFPTEKLFNQTKLSGIETYSYLTNLPFKDLSSKLLVFLGEGWSEDQQDPESEEQINATMKDQKMNLLGNSMFSNKEKFPGMTIGLTSVEMEGKLDEEKTSFVNVTVMKLPLTEKKKVDFKPADPAPQ